MENNKIVELIKYLTKKKFEVVKHTHDYHIVYNTQNSSFVIQLYVYSDMVKFATEPYMKKANLHRKRVSFKRADYKTAIYKTILEIQGYLDKLADIETKEIEEKKKYAPEIEEYFIEKFGATSIKISPLKGYFSTSNDDDREIFVESVKDKERKYYHIRFIDGKYSLVYETTEYKDVFIFEENLPE